MSNEPNEHASVADEQSLGALLAARARRTGDGQLATAAATGIVGAVAIGLFFPTWWRLALPFVSLGAFGVWGIVDRMAAERRGIAGSTPGTIRLLAAIGWVAVLIGGLSVVTLVLALTATAIGTWNL
jgi:hypothetical protein